jgi:hypothetical protein
MKPNPLTVASGTVAKLAGVGRPITPPTHRAS